MIIRSQDKKSIVNLNNLDTVCVGKDNAIDVYNGEIATRCTIAIYSTEERAIKVLDMIEDAIRNIAFTDGVVFRMPQDSEV